MVQEEGKINVEFFVAIDFQINFIYILASQKGSTHNSRVINLAKAKGLEVLVSKYCIIDIKYSNIPITLTPYYSIQYYF